MNPMRLTLECRFGASRDVVTLVTGHWSRSFELKLIKTRESLHLAKERMGVTEK